MTIEDIKFFPLNDQDELVCSYDFIDENEDKQTAWYGLKGNGYFLEWTPKLKKESHHAILQAIDKWNKKCN